MPAPLPEKPVVRKKNRQRNQMLITAGVMAVLVIGLSLVLLLGGPDSPPPVAQPAAPFKLEPNPPVNTPEEPTSTASALVADDGRTLWASPTSGDAIPLQYLPPGCDLILHVRPADWQSTEQGERSLAALGPQGAAVVSSLEQMTGASLDAIDELVLGVRGAVGNALEATVVVRPIAALRVQGDWPEPPARYRTARIAQHNGASYRVGSPWCCFAPPVEEGRVYVVGSRPAIQEVIEAGGAAPPLRREIESLAASGDRARHATLITAPSFLFSQGRGLFAGITESLRSPTFEFVPDTVKAASVSLHWGDSFYIEASANPAPEITATRLAALLDKRVSDWSSALQLAVLDLNPAPHGRRVVAQLPAMTRLLAEYTRFGVVGDASVLNAYLPAAAGQNLLAAGELMLAQHSSGAIGTTRASIASAPQAQGIAEKLRQTASVAFARDTLEMAAQYLAEEIDAPVVILGADLQLEGITKNQSFGLDATNEPAGDILLKILTSANPDKTASGPQDPKQKLIYVIKKDERSVDTVYITTRAAAAKRGDKVPAVFQP